jgi:hypothetical protein
LRGSYPLRYELGEATLRPARPDVSEIEFVQPELNKELDEEECEEYADDQLLLSAYP